MKRHHSSIMVKKNPVIVFGDTVTAYGCIRALSSYGIDIFIVSKTGQGMATGSRFVKGVLSLSSDDPDFIERLNCWTISQAISNAILIVTTDLYLDALAKNIDFLLPDMKPTFPNWETVALVRDKSRTLQMAETLNVPTPKTFEVTSFSALKQFFVTEPSIEYPLMVRPETSNIYKTRGELCYSEGDVYRLFKEHGGFGGKMLIQEMIPGGVDNLINISVVTNKSGELLSIFMNRKIRTMKPFEPGTLLTSVWSDEACRYTLKLLKKIRYFGYTETEFKYDRRDNTFKLIEINGRLSMLNSHALRCGINLPHLIYLDVTGESVPPLTEYKITYQEGILWWYLIPDIISIIQNGNILRPIKCIKELIGRGYIVEPFCLRDMKPFFISLKELMVAFFRKLGR